MDNSATNTPPAANYLEQAKQFLKSSRLLRAAPLALMAVTSVHAVVSSAPIFSAPNSVSVFACDSGGSSTTTTSLSGTPVNTSHGISLFGAASRTLGSVPAGFPDCLRMQWVGTGSGTFGASALPVSWVFSITGNAPPSVTVNNWLMTVTLNSTPTTFNCSGNCSGGSITGSGSAATPGSAVAFTSWSVLLQVNGTWNTPGGSINVIVPGATSIDINAVATPAAAAGVPVLTNTMLALLAAGLLAMGSAYLNRPNWGAPRG